MASDTGIRELEDIARNLWYALTRSPNFHARAEAVEAALDFERWAGKRASHNPNTPSQKKGRYEG